MRWEAKKKGKRCRGREMQNEKQWRLFDPQMKTSNQLQGEQLRNEKKGGRGEKVLPKKQKLKTELAEKC